MKYPYEYIIEKHPKIAQRILLTWGTWEGRFYLNNLLFDSRDGDRDGFSKDVAKALFALINQHDDLFPEFRPRLDTWHNVL